MALPLAQVGLSDEANAGEDASDVIQPPLDRDVRLLPPARRGLVANELCRGLRQRDRALPRAKMILSEHELRN